MQSPHKQTEEEIHNLRETVEMLQKTITQNKMFLYMVIHDLKHPTESMISQLNAMHLSLIDQIQTINSITERQERIEKFIADSLLDSSASARLNSSIEIPRPDLNTDLDNEKNEKPNLSPQYLFSNEIKFDDSLQSNVSIDQHIMNPVPVCVFRSNSPLFV